MNIRCPHCGTDYEVDEKDMYRYTKCEVCGKGFVIGSTKSLQKVDGGGNEEESQRKKPKLGIRRPPQQPSQEATIMEDKLRAAINYQPPQKPLTAPKGVVTAAEERVKLFEEMRRKNARQKMIRNFIDTVILLGTLVVLVALCLWWKWHKNKVAEEEFRIYKESEVERIRLSEERDRVDRERREKDRQDKAAEQERRRAEELRLQQEEQQRIMREKEERDRVEREKREGQEDYQLRLTVLREGRFMLFAPSVTNGMEMTGGELCYLLPSLENHPLIVYQSLYGTNEARRVFRLHEDGKKEESDVEAFTDRIKDVEYLVVKGDTVYFHSIRKTPWSGILNKSKDGDPADVFFGSLATTMKSLKASYEELTFDIFFTSKDGGKRIFVENVEFGGTYSIDAVRDALEKAYPLKSYGISGGASSGAKKFKRTVKMWGGAMIKLGVDGITYVPMSPPSVRRESCSRPDYLPSWNVYRSRTRTYSYNDQNYERWKTLYEKAKQEEAMEQEYYERQRSERVRRRDKAQSDAERKWQERLEKIFNAGTITYNLRKAKGK